MKKSESITNQKLMLTDFVNNNKELELVSTKIDDGYGGSNFDRPAFKEMIKDIEKGKINCVVVKDFSRFGRDFIEVGKYLEEIFPLMNVRFISVNDNYDSFKSTESIDNLIIPFKNLINDSYLRDISLKIRSSFNVNRKKGEFIGSFVTYGYLKDSNNKNKIVIDEIASKVVQDIFKYRLEGLSADKKDEKNKNIKWNLHTIKKILSDEVYIGNMVQGKKINNLYKNEKQKLVPKDEWKIVYNTHEPIIDKEIFNKVNEINNNAKAIYLENNKNKLLKNKTENIFKGLIKCGDCNKNLIRRERNKQNKNNIKILRFFECNYKKQNNCNLKSIKEDLVKEIVFEEIKKQIEIAVKLETIINKQSKVISLEENRLKSLLENTNIEINKIKNFYKVIYEDYRAGLLTEEDYIFTKNNYLEKEKELNKNKENLHKQILDLENNLSKENKYLKNFLKFKNSKVLTKKLLQILIKEICAYDNNTIQITFNYITEYNMLLDEMERILKNVI